MATSRSFIRRLRSQTKSNKSNKTVKSSSAPLDPDPATLVKTAPVRTKFFRRKSTNVKTFSDPAPAVLNNKRAVVPSKRVVSHKKIDPTKKDAVFGRGRKKDHVRNGSLYRYLIEQNYVAYASLNASETQARRAFVKTKVIDAILKKGGRFILRQGEKLSLLNVGNHVDLKLIFKKIQRALFNERKRREDAEIEAQEKSKPSKVFTETVYEDDGSDYGMTDDEDNEERTLPSVSDLEDQVDEDMVDGSDDEDLEEELPPLVLEKNESKMIFNLDYVSDDDKEVASLDNDRPSSRASLKLDQLAYLATTLLEEAANVSSDEDMDDESIILGIGRSRTPSPVLMTPSPAPTGNLTRVCSRLPVKKRKSIVDAPATGTKGSLAAVNTYSELVMKCIKDGSLVLPTKTMLPDNDSFNQVWMHHLRRELFPTSMTLKPRISNIEEQLNRVYAPVNPFFTPI